MGYERAGFQTTGVDIEPQPHYPFEFVQADCLEYLAEHGHEFDAIHASPPCQGYSIMHNLPWLRNREYPLLILPLIEMLEELSKPYVVENVMGARHGSATLRKRGLEAHGLQAGWLCGAMFGLPFYRHRLFATNWLWLAPGHPKHQGHITTGAGPQQKGRDISEQIVSKTTQEGGLNIRPGYEKVPFSMPTLNPVNTEWRKYHDGQPLRTDRNGRGRVKDKKLSFANMKGTERAGWHLAAEAMGIDWMNRAELTQAIPPAYTEHIGRQALAYIGASL